MRNYKLVILSAIMLSGCVHSSRVQMDYIGQRDECRTVAESNQSAYGNRNTGQGNLSPQLNAADANAVLAKIFSDCMYVNGWTVATPPSQEPRPSDPSAPPPPPNGGQQVANNEPNGNELEWLSQPGTDKTVARSARTPEAGAANAGSQPQQQPQQMRPRPQGYSNPAAAPLQSQPVPSNMYVPQPQPPQAMPAQPMQRRQVPQ